MQRTTNSDARCPTCNSLDLVRYWGLLGTLGGTRARCIDCGQVFSVDISAARRIPVPELAELAGASTAEWASYTLRSKMTVGQAFVTVVGAGIGLAWVILGVLPELSIVPILAGWWIGRLAFPRHECRALKRILHECKYRLCTKCKYRLDGLPERGHCPECGTSYAVADLMAYWKHKVS